MLACARCKLWWMTPEWRTSTLALPPETQFLLVDLGHGECGGTANGASAGGHSQEAYAIILPLIDGDFRTTLRAGRWVREGGSGGAATILPCAKASLRSSTMPSVLC